jgi:large subunit ribosomal protein L17
MRHRKSGRKFGRDASHRKAMIKNLLSSLIRYEVIQTTDAKAKELRRYADKLITLAKKDSVHARRLAFARLQDSELVGKLFDDLAKRSDLKDRQGGYTRVIKLLIRQSDSAPISRISWVGSTLENTEKLRYPAHILERFETDEDAEAEA